MQLGRRWMRSGVPSCSQIEILFGRAGIFDRRPRRTQDDTRARRRMCKQQGRIRIEILRFVSGGPGLRSEQKEEKGVPASRPNFKRTKT